MGRRLRGLSALQCFAVSAAAGVLIFGCFFLATRRRPAAGPLKISLWYWHQPFRVAPADAICLRQMGVQTLFVRAATLARDRDSGALRSVLPQTWSTRADGFTVQLVFNADYSIVRSLGTVSNDALAAAFVSAVQHERARAQAAGIVVGGIQLDFDVPTRLLSRYAALLHELRTDPRVVPPGNTFSITALPTWLASRDLRAVAAEVDFIAPQFYESEIPKTLTAFATISNEARLRSGLKRAEALGTPFWAGLPTYGHALVFDGTGKLRGAFHDSGVLDMAHQPYYRIVRADPSAARGAVAKASADFIGETIVELGPTGLGVRDQTNFHLIFDLPTPTLFARQLAIVRDHRPENCAGVILYRYPEQFPTAAVALPSLLSVLKGRVPKPHLKFSVYDRPYAPWRGIEGGEDPEGPSRNVFVNVTNDGDGQAGVAPDAVDVAVQFNGRGLRVAASGGFDTAEPFVDTPGNRASLARANGVRFSTLHLAPDQMLIAGPIRVATGTPVAKITWRVSGDGGLSEYRGSLDLPPAKTNEAHR